MMVYDLYGSTGDLLIERIINDSAPDLHVTIESMIFLKEMVTAFVCFYVRKAERMTWESDSFTHNLKLCLGLPENYQGPSESHIPSDLVKNLMNEMFCSYPEIIIEDIKLMQKALSELIFLLVKAAKDEKSLKYGDLKSAVGVTHAIEGGFHDFFAQYHKVLVELPCELKSKLSHPPILSNEAKIFLRERVVEFISYISRVKYIIFQPMRMVGYKPFSVLGQFNCREARGHLLHFHIETVEHIMKSTLPPGADISREFLCQTQVNASECIDILIRKAREICNDAVTTKYHLNEAVDLLQSYDFTDFVGSFLLKYREGQLYFSNPKEIKISESRMSRMENQIAVLESRLRLLESRETTLNEVKRIYEETHPYMPRYTLWLKFPPPDNRRASMDYILNERDSKKVDKVNEIFKVFGQLDESKTEFSNTSVKVVFIDPLDGVKACNAVRSCSGVWKDSRFCYLEDRGAVVPMVTLSEADEKENLETYPSIKPGVLLLQTMASEYGGN